jgi:DNA-directed RNA polymerase subunit RPC12/RpoP
MKKGDLLKDHVISKCPRCGQGVIATPSREEYRAGLIVNCESCGEPVLFKKGNEVGELSLIHDTFKEIGWKRLLVLVLIAVVGIVLCRYYIQLNIWLGIALSISPLAYHYVSAQLRVLKRRFGSWE